MRGNCAALANLIGNEVYAGQSEAESERHEIRVVHKIILSVIEINWIYEMNFITNTRYAQIGYTNWGLINGTREFCSS